MHKKTVTRCKLYLLTAGALAGFHSAGVYAQNEETSAVPVPAETIPIPAPSVEKDQTAVPVDPPFPALSPDEQQQADALIQSAKERAMADAEKGPAPIDDKNAVRVNYVPEFIKDEIRAQVRAELRADVVQDVLSHAKNEQWGLPQALPGWISRLTWKGDVRLRVQMDAYGNDNLQPGYFYPSTYLDFMALNTKGGFGKAGLDAFVNITEDRQRLRERARLALDAKVNDTLAAGFRISTGNTRDPVSTNQTLANYGNRYQVLWDQAYLKYDGLNADRFPWLSLYGGRIPNPWLSTDLIWDSDLAFEGLAGTLRFNLRGSESLLEKSERDRILFLTLGAFPLQEVELSKRDKWLYGAQLGTDLIFLNQSKLRMALSYYHYENITGIRNPDLEGTTTNYTAPGFMQKGNGVFDISNDTNTDTDLWGLAADYKLANFTVEYDSAAFAPYHVIVTADYVRNIGYDKDEIEQRTATSGRVEHAGGTKATESALRARVAGYQVALGIGWPIVAEPSTWRVFSAYRYLQRDAVLDAFTDSDFHLGGTDTKGWLVGGDYAIAENTWLTLKYMTSDAIDGAPLAIDTVQLDLNAKF